MPWSHGKNWQHSFMFQTQRQSWHVDVILSLIVICLPGEMHILSCMQLTCPLVLSAFQNHGMQAGMKFSRRLGQLEHWRIIYYWVMCAPWDVMIDRRSDVSVASWATVWATQVSVSWNITSVRPSRKTSDLSLYQWLKVTFSYAPRSIGLHTTLITQSTTGLQLQ